MSRGISSRMRWGGGRPRSRPSNTSLRSPSTAFGDVLLPDLEHHARGMSGGKRPSRPDLGTGSIAAFQQALRAAARWAAMAQNPAKLAGTNPQPKPGDQPVPPKTRSTCSPSSWGSAGPLVIFACETGMRPERIARGQSQRRSRCRSGARGEDITRSGRRRHTARPPRSRRRIPLSTRALLALDAIPRRLDARLIFLTRENINLHNWRQRDWKPTLEATRVCPGKGICGHPALTSRPGH